MFSYPKGSVWRKWDLQVQSILDDGYVSLADYYEEIKAKHSADWIRYVNRVGGEENALLFDSKEYFNNGSIAKSDRCINYVRNFHAYMEIFHPELECVGMTDHNYFDDCLLDAFIEFNQKSQCKVIPGVEINCQGVHLLAFFCNNLYGKLTFSAGIQTFLIKCKVDNRVTPDGKLTTTSADIKDVLSEVKNNRGIIIYPHCNSSNGLFQERGKTDRTHLADIFNHQSVNLLQSQHHKSSLEILDYIKRSPFFTSKYSCHISSDARALRDFGRPDRDGNFLWVKADPTFEGLKQIIFEPDHRIHVGPQKPNLKKPYFVIDNVRFISNATESKFPEDPIEINQNLTTVIGGKSTGKSLFLYYIAKTIDSNEVKSRTEVANVKYDVDLPADFNFEVTWADGEKNLLKLPTENPNKEFISRKILYIPQKYLNALSEGTIKGRDALNAFVLNVILQDLEVNEKYQQSMQEIRLALKGIPIAIGELFSELSDIANREEELKQAGDVNGIAAYTAMLKKQVDEIKNNSGLSSDQIIKYEELVSNEKGIVSRVSNLDMDKKTIKAFDSAVKSQIEGLNVVIKEYLSYINDLEIRKQFASELKKVDDFASLLVKSVEQMVSSVDDKIESDKQALVAITSELAPLLAKVQLQSELLQKTDSIKNEEKKLNEISIKRNNLNLKKVSYEKKCESILTAYKTVFDKFETLRGEFKKFETLFGEITLEVSLNFNDAKFNSDVVKEYLNRSDLRRCFTEAQWGDDFIYSFDALNHLANIGKAFHGVLAGNINTVKNRQKKDALEKLLDNYFYLDFGIFYKGDPLDRMSPGKKGLVLLQLLINLSNEEWPVLIDQPEDDLDNRSVYEDLVGFLKTKKNQRQIIIVTHNPNLVVGADGEEVIVANQSGQEIGRDNKKYRFEYVSGALENSFEVDVKKEPAVLFRKGVRQHVCEILEGGKEAFQKREQKYNFPT